LLRLLTQQVHVDVASELLVVGDFEVLIRPACSGIEGMVLLGIFSSAYVYRFRKTLRFPQAFSLIPLAIAAAWLTNIVRIAALALIGAHWSPAIAAGGFHSKAGWLAFCGLALGVVLLGQRAYAQPRTAADAEIELHNPTAVYCLPLVALLSVGMLTTSLSATLDLAYAARIMVAVLVLYAFRDSYRPLLQAPSWQAVLLGAAVFGVWWLLTGPANAQHNLEVAAELRSLSVPVAALWLIARFIGSVLIVPVVEELAFRGYLLRRLSTTAADFEALSHKQISVVAWITSSLAFGCLHGQWIAGTLAGAAYAGIMIWRGRLVDAVLAHAVTNALLSLVVVTGGRWDLW
jgi:exosortase E/protease (VPEID-CTERM system)